MFTRTLKRLWTREKPDGKKGWGALRFLLLGVIVSALGLWSIHRMDITGVGARAKAVSGEMDTPVNPAVKDVRLGEVAKAAQSTEPLELKAQKTDGLADSQVGMTTEAEPDATTATTPAPSAVQSYFGDPADKKSAAASAGPVDPNNSIFEALSRSDEATSNDGRPANDADSSIADGKPGAKGSHGPGSAAGGATTSADSASRSGFGPPTVGTNPGSEIHVQAIESLVVRDMAPPGSLDPPTVATAPAPGRPKSRFLPRGEIIPVYLMQTVQTGKFPTLVEFAVAKTIYFNGKPVLPFGTRFLGTAGLGVRDRITFSIDSLQRRDGLSLAVRGMVLGTDQMTGLQAYYIAQPAMAQLAPFIGSFAEAYAELYEERAQATSLTVGSVSVSSQPSLSSQSQDLAISAMSQSMTGFIRAQLAQINDRYASYLTAPEGSAAYVQLVADTDFSALWDNTLDGKVATVGTPQVVSTEDAYQKRDDQRIREEIATGPLAQAQAAAAQSLAPASTTTALAQGAGGQPVAGQALSPVAAATTTSAPVANPFN